MSTAASAATLRQLCIRSTNVKACRQAGWIETEEAAQGMVQRRARHSKPTARTAALRQHAGRARRIGRAGVAAMAPPPRETLPGFDPDYAGIADYAIRSTERIGDDRAVGLIYSHYKHDVVVHAPLGVTRSRDEVIADTLRALAAFPDRRTSDHAVAWSSDGAGGFYTSHRFVSRGRNTGWSDLAPPTGRKASWLTVMDSVVHENRVCEAWIVRDNLAIVLELGLEPRAVAQKLAAHKIARGETLPGFGDVDRLPGQFPPSERCNGAIPGDEAVQHVCQALHDLWNRRRFDAADAAYARGALAHLPGLRRARGPKAIGDAVIAVLAMMSNAGMIIHRACAVSERGGGRLVAVRWTLDGHHDGPGRLGEPTGKRLTLMGMTHAVVRGSRIIEEWTVFDELSLLVQLELPSQ